MKELNLEHELVSQRETGREFRQAAHREAIVVNAVTKKFSAPSPFLGRRGAVPAWKAPVVERPALKKVSFTVEAGEIFGLWGLEGAGKSTLIRLLAALLSPDEGDILVYGYSVRLHPEQVRRLTNPGTPDRFLKKLSPVENLLNSARQDGLPARRERVVSLLERVGLSGELAFQPMERLPRGLQVKASLARALLGAPRVLILDEPTAGLDSATRREIYTLLRQLRDRDGLTILLATRDRAEAEALCNRVAVLEAGRLAAIETPGCFQWPGIPFKSLLPCHELPLTVVEVEAACD